MKKVITAKLLILVLLVSACAPGLKTTATDSNYYEDLSIYRPKLAEEQVDTLKLQDPGSLAAADVKPVNDVTGRVNYVLDSIARINKKKNYVDGYTIQVYSGYNREEARLAKGKAMTLVPDHPSRLIYLEPNFKVKAGKFYTRLEAHKAYALLKKEFTNAIIIPEKIRLN